MTRGIMILLGTLKCFALTFSIVLLLSHLEGVSLMEFHLFHTYLYRIVILICQLDLAVSYISGRAKTTKNGEFD